MLPCDSTLLIKIPIMEVLTFSWHTRMHSSAVVFLLETYSHVFHISLKAEYCMNSINFTCEFSCRTYKWRRAHCAAASFCRNVFPFGVDLLLSPTPLVFVFFFFPPSPLCLLRVERSPHTYRSRLGVFSSSKWPVARHWKLPFILYFFFPEQ